jgi:hypothetical protein
MKTLPLLILLLGCPPVGLLLQRRNDIHLYFQFPPEARYIAHPSFSWTVFSIYFVTVLFILVLLRFKVMRRVPLPQTIKPPVAGSFPWWGWLTVITGILAWVFAWTRFSWFERFQPHTFVFLWLSFIVVTNALSYRKSGHCPLLDHTKSYLILFPLSSAFWWSFEYLNRFTQNWYYTGAQFTSWQYFCFATLSFSTVLPAVLATNDWVSHSSWINAGFHGSLRISFSHPKSIAWASLVTSSLTLVFIGVRPDLLFPFLWISPLLIIVSLQTLYGNPNVFSRIAHGDWRLIVSSSVAAILCGWFWEMWNYYSFAKWHYSIPYVQRFHLFEMPILGYAGYLPFGLECVAATSFFLPKQRPRFLRED